MELFEVLFVATLSVVAIFAIFTRRYGALIIVIFAIVSQNFLCIIVSEPFDSSVIQFAILFKEVVVYGVVVSAFALAGVRYFKRNAFLFLFLVMLAIYFPVGGNAPMAKLACLRAILTPISLLMFGMAISLSPKERTSALRLFVCIGIFLSIFGFLEAYALGNSFWSDLGIEAFYSHKGFSNWIGASGVPSQFVAYDFFELVGEPIRRMASLVAEPLAFGHIMVLCFSLLLFDDDTIIRAGVYKNALLAIFFVSALASFSKGALLGLALALLVRFGDFKRPFWWMFCIALCVFVLYWALGNMTTSMGNHAEGLVSSFSGHVVFGDGVGSGGNYSGLYGEGGEGGESFIGAMIVQMGVPGAILFLLAFAEIFISVARFHVDFNASRKGMACGVLSFALACLIESFVSESALSFIGSGMGFVMLGHFYRIAQQAGAITEILPGKIVFLKKGTRRV